MERKTIKLTVLILAMCVLAGTCMTAFADGLDGAVTAFGGGMKDLYHILEVVVLPIAGIVIAFCGIKIIAGTERESEAAKTTLKRLFIGLAIVFIAPFIVETIAGWFSSVGGENSSIWTKT